MSGDEQKASTNKEMPGAQSKRRSEGGRYRGSRCL